MNTSIQAQPETAEIEIQTDDVAIFDAMSGSGDPAAAGGPMTLSDNNSMHMTQQ